MLFYQLCFFFFGLLLLSGGCARHYPEYEMGSGKGNGTSKTYDASSEAVWDNTLEVLDELEMKIEQKNEGTGFIRVSNPYPTELFIKSISDNTQTEFEVACLDKPNYYDYDIEQKIHKNVEMNVNDATWKSYWMHDSPYYVKMMLMGARGEKIPLYMTETATGEDMYIDPYPAGGLAISFDLGYNIDDELSVELGLGEGGYGVSSCIHRNDLPTVCQKGYFGSKFASLTMLYHFYRYLRGEYHINGGADYYFSPELTRTDADINTVVTYNDTLGYHVGVGGSWGISAIYLFFDLNYAFGVKYKYKQITENGVTSPTIYPEWKEISGDGEYFSIGIGYRF
jgi:hypothetical protein